MDYSLLVGLDESGEQLVVGIIGKYQLNKYQLKIDMFFPTAIFVLIFL